MSGKPLKCHIRRRMFCYAGWFVAIGVAQVAVHFLLKFKIGGLSALFWPVSGWVVLTNYLYQMFIDDWLFAPFFAKLWVILLWINVFLVGLYSAGCNRNLWKCYLAVLFFGSMVIGFAMFLNALFHVHWLPV